MLKILGRRAKRRMTRPTRLYPELVHKYTEQPADLITSFLGGSWSMIVKANGERGHWYERIKAMPRNRFWTFDCEAKH